MSAQGNKPEDGTVGAADARLFSSGWKFDFFQAVWLLERSLRDSASVGAGGPVSRERIRFRPHLSMGFPATDIRRVALVDDADGGPGNYQLDVTFMGLYGVATPLPLHFAIDVLRSVELRPDAVPAAAGADGTAADTSFGSSPTRDFLDVLHHRLISFFYRSWTKYRYDVAFGIPDRDRITDYLRWLIGTPPATDPATLGLPPLRLLRYAGVLTQHPRSATTLEGLLYDFGGIPAVVRQFIGRWVALSTADTNRLGAVNSGLGVDLTVGEQVFDLCGLFRVVFGPMDWATYRSFLPDGERFKQAQKLVRLYCGDPLSYSFELRLKAGEVPVMELTSSEGGSRLGYTSWVRTDEMPETSVVFEAA